MGLFDFVRRRTQHVPPPPTPDFGLFQHLGQDRLNNLASILPIALDLARSPGRATVVIGDVSPSDADLVRNLDDRQFDALRDIQQLYLDAQQTTDTRKKLTAYLDCLQRAPWHPYAMSSVGVCCYNLGQEAKAYEYLRAALRLHPNDTSIYANLSRISQLASRDDNVGDTILMKADIPITESTRSDVVGIIERTVELYRLEIKQRFGAQGVRVDSFELASDLPEGYFFIKLEVEAGRDGVALSKEAAKVWRSIRRTFA